MEGGLTLRNPESTALTVISQPDDGLTRLIGFYEEAEQASSTAREKAERDRDYVDNKQLTDAEVAALQKRGQPPIALNVVRSRAAFLSGMEKKQRRDPKAWPRNNPNDVQAAEAFTDGMRYVIDVADYPSVRSQAWKNITVEGFGGIELSAVQKRNGEFEFKIQRIPWDRLFYDPHSSEPDFSDARYVGQVLWMDYDEALSRAVNAGADEADVKAVLESTLDGAPGTGRTYDDKPKWSVWADAKRKRVRVVMIWHREPSGWKYCEFTRGGKLLAMDGVYLDQDGETYCPWVIESANVDRDNNRYGEIRHLIDPQDEYNKRRSKALHLMSVSGVIAEEGAVEDVNAARREIARPDFWITKRQGAEMEIIRGLELASGQVAMAEQALSYIMQAGPNAALLGKGTEDQSGRAIEAQQAGGLVEQSDLMDTLRRLDLRVFRIIAQMIKQFWTAEKWIRVTDDELSPQWVGLNIPQTRVEADPYTGQEIEVPVFDPNTGYQALQNNVAELDMDIIVSDAPDSITLDGETFQAVTEVLKSGLPPPMLKFVIELHPGLTGKRKKQLIDMIDEMAKPQDKPPEAQEAERLAKEMAEAEVADKRAGAYQKLAAGESALAKVYMQPLPLPDVEAGLTDEGQGMPPPQPRGPPPGPMDGPPAMRGPGPQMPPPGPPMGPGQGLVGMMTG